MKRPDVKIEYLYDRSEFVLWLDGEEYARCDIDMKHPHNAVRVLSLLALAADTLQLGYDMAINQQNFEDKE